MEMTTRSFSYAKPNSLSSSSFFPPKSTFVGHSSVNFLGYNCLPRNLKCSARQLRNFGAINASDSESGRISASVRWLLEPIENLRRSFAKENLSNGGDDPPLLIADTVSALPGNGDSRHIGYKIAMPDAFEIASNEVTIGRVREKADVVIPVPTVSGVHARIQKTEDNLLITDLDSTNGTFIDERRLTPGVVAAASPGNLITFGDTNLAIFRVYKLQEEVFTTDESEIPESKPEEEPSNTS